MEKHELLKYAYDNYPKGTNFNQMYSGKLINSTGVFKLNIYETWFNISDSVKGDFVYCSFNDRWAEIVSDKNPFLVSEDGIPLYGDEHIFLCWIDSNTGNARYKESFFDNTCNYTSKIFSTKQSALEWIESQKPKSYEVKLFNGGTANLYKNEIILHGGIKLAPSDLEDLSHSFRMYFGKDTDNA